MSERTSKGILARCSNALILLLAIAGLVSMIISSTMSTANVLYGLPSLVIFGIIGLVFIAVQLVAPSAWRKNGYLSLVAIMGAIVMFTMIIGNVLNSRVLLISGLFSFNSQNTVGWNVLFVTIVSMVCFLVAILLLIISAFMKSNK